MGWSKSTRISIMLAIDIVFFFLELTVGFLVHSLALTADAFHMLNDIISLIVGLWAVKIARKATTDKYSYGWLRAEILGAFFNAVFLIALCVSIVLEALTRFIEPPEIDNPKLILIVGSLGLASNLVGFLVLGGHGHSHGPGEHSHGEHDHEHDHEHEQAHSHAHGDGISRAEEGVAGLYNTDGGAGDENGRPADDLPEAAVARYQAAAGEAARSGRLGRSNSTQSDNRDRCGSRISIPRGRDKRRTGSVRHGRLHSIEDITIHPASFRQEIIEASRPRIEEDSSSEATESDSAERAEAGEHTPLLKGDAHDKRSSYNSSGRSKSRRSRRNSNHVHYHHNHNKPRKANKSSHGHSHGDMGMNAMILHVLGDALGNVGVIATALIIWLTDWPGKVYADPAVSLFITLIILRSAVPLTVAASKILLQATPDNIDLNEVREDIQALPGVISCHHVHIWQLSDTKIVASLHIEVSFAISEAGGEKYMDLAKMARKCLHAYGIHSATIQPEFCLDRVHDHGEDVAMQVDGGVDIAPKAKKMVGTDGTLCLLECVDDCVGKGCCTSAGSVAASSHSAHSHCSQE